MSDRIAGPVLHDFRILRPRFNSAQENSFSWIPAAHSQADLTRALPGNDEKYRKILRRIGCSSQQIARRGHELDDFNHTRWPEMRIFRCHESPQGAGMEARTLAYLESVQAIFGRFYESDSTPPNDLIHVTCTGYVSPSPAQRLVADKGWGNQTEVTHAYHMGCYASVPAIRQARGFLAAHPGKNRVDLVHTELCGLHLNPADHSLENFVIQTLFADGFARYSMSPALPAGARAGFEVLALREVVIPNSHDAMTWMCGDWGMKMTLSKDVPSLIAGHLTGFLHQLLEPLGLDLDAIRSDARFAVHPGGPKILDQVQESLSLRPEQLAASREVLGSFGNMSSATLPHIWEMLLADESVPANALVLSLAFGPGLTLCGAVLKKMDNTR